MHEKLLVLELLVLEMQGGICLPVTAKELTDFIIGISGISQLIATKECAQINKVGFLLEPSIFLAWMSKAEVCTLLLVSWLI